MFRTPRKILVKDTGLLQYLRTCMVSSLGWGIAALDVQLDNCSICEFDQPLGARGGVQTQYITNTLQGNGQRTYQIPTWNIPRTFRIFPANLTEISPVQEMLRTFTVYPGDFLIRRYVGKFKMFPKNVPIVFLGGSFKVFFVMSPAK
jgi:hypothetical protein